MTDTNTTQDAAQAAAEEILFVLYGDWIVVKANAPGFAEIIRRHFPTPVAPESGEFAGHTPGPWHYGSDPDSNGRYLAVGNGTIIVCRMNPCVNPEANARLIAAAPTLLAERDARKAENDALKAEVDTLRMEVGRLRLGLLDMLNNFAGNDHETPFIVTARAALEGKE